MNWPFDHIETNAVAIPRKLVGKRFAVIVILCCRIFPKYWSTNVRTPIKSTVNHLWKIYSKQNIDHDLWMIGMKMEYFMRTSFFALLKMKLASVDATRKQQLLSILPPEITFKSKVINQMSHSHMNRTRAFVQWH